MTVRLLLSSVEAENLTVLPEGNRTTPSYVAFSAEERLIGDAAKNQAAMNPRNTVFDVKSVTLCFPFLSCFPSMCCLMCRLNS